MENLDLFDVQGQSKELVSLAKALSVACRSSSVWATIALSSAFCSSMMEEWASFDLALNLFRLNSLPSVLKTNWTPVGRLLPMRWRMAAIKTEEGGGNNASLIDSFQP